MLTDGSDEIETRVGQRVQIPTPDVSEAMHDCPGCGMGNRTNSKFCKKCGVAISPPMAFGSFVAPSLEATQHFRQGIFTPPQSVSSSASRPRGSNTSILLGSLVGAVIVVGGIIVYSLSSGDTGSNKALNSNRAANKPANTAANNTPTRRSNDSRIGKTGTLTTDVNIRPVADANAAKLGTHYRDARVEILDVADGVTKDGTTMTFFRIRVLSYGVSTEPSNYGLGKDVGTPDEGWVNGYPVIYGHRQDLIKFD